MKHHFTFDVLLSPRLDSDVLLYHDSSTPLLAFGSRAEFVKTAFEIDA